MTRRRMSDGTTWRTAMTEEQICSICGKSFEDYGNNAQPVNDGECCDDCNERVVLTERFESL